MAETVQIITWNNGTGDHDPALVTRDKERAKQKYLAIIQAEDRKVEETDEDRIRNPHTRDGIEHGEFFGDCCVKIDGVWYINADDYGDPIARWFEHELERDTATGVPATPGQMIGVGDSVVAQVNRFAGAIAVKKGDVGKVTTIAHELYWVDFSGDGRSVGFKRDELVKQPAATTATHA